MAYHYQTEHDHEFCADSSAVSSSVSVGEQDSRAEVGFSQHFVEYLNLEQ